jgi:serine/threonine protein phosphatase PrpC
MEDAHLAELDFDKEKQLFGVFDGHGGKEVAIWTERNLVDIIMKNKKYNDGDYEEALYKSFIEVDKQLGTLPQIR